MSIETEIREFFDDYELRWNQQRFDELADVWDKDDPQPFYRPMEFDGYISSRPDLERYFVPNPGKSAFDELNFQYTDLKIKSITPDVAIVMSDFKWDMKLKGGKYAKPMSGRDPVIMVLKKKPEGWRLSAYVESCMHPVMYVKKIAELAVRPDFLNVLHDNGQYESPRPNGGAPLDYWAG